MLSVCPGSGALTQVRRELLSLPHAALSPSVERKHLFNVWQCPGLQGVEGADPACRHLADRLLEALLKLMFAA